MMTLLFLIDGRVQGVGYRHFASASAEAFDIAGWVRNLPDGRVEVVATGTETNLRAFREQLELGSRGSRVDRVDSREIDPSGVRGFAIRT